ncbi:unnamed protein product [Colias eurytheme]|nr:unnamed protein product [Colias eurytheme]
MGVRNAVKPPSHTAYFVAMAGILGLLLLLCCYFLYFCIKRVKELSRQGLPEPVQSVRPPPPETVPYPVQPVVRASASAMARLCQSPRGPLSPRAPLSPRTPRSPLSPHALRSPAREPYVHARANSLIPHTQHTSTVHPHRARTLPPPTILPQRPHEPTSLAIKKHNAPAPKSPAPRRKQDEVVRRTRDRSANDVAKKHLSAPPEIVVGDSQ